MAVTDGQVSGEPVFESLNNRPRMGFFRASCGGAGKNEQWKSSNSLGRNEIPLAIYCLEKAFEAMIEEQQASEEEVL